MNELTKNIILLVIGTLLGVIGTVVATVITGKILGRPDSKADAMKNRQKKIGWPWEYTVDEEIYLFPKEINDGERNEIFIHFQIPQKYYQDDLILTLYSYQLLGDIFLVDILAKHANGNFKKVETVTFDQQAKNLKKKIMVPLDSVGPGANTFHLKNATPPFTNHLLFWDYLSLRTKDDIIIWEIGKENGSQKRFHDLRFCFP